MTTPMEQAREHLEKGLRDLAVADDATTHAFNVRQLRYASASAHMAAGLLLVFTKIMEVDAEKSPRWPQRPLVHNTLDRNCATRMGSGPWTEQERCYVCNPEPPVVPPF